LTVSRLGLCPMINLDGRKAIPQTYISNFIPARINMASSSGLLPSILLYESIEKQFEFKFDERICCEFVKTFIDFKKQTIAVSIPIEIEIA